MSRYSVARIIEKVTDAEIAALEKARDAAFEDGDRAHVTALEKSIAFKQRLKREQDAGVESPAVVWMED